MSKSVKMFPGGYGLNMWYVSLSSYLSIFKNMYIKMCQNLSKYVKMYPGGGGLNTWYVCQSVHLTVSGIFSKCAKICT